MSEEQLDRFARGELTPAESRDLAQQALDDPELFDELTSTALARTALRRSGRSRITWPRIAWIVAAAAAVVILAVALYIPRRPSQLAPQTTAISSQPILLSQNSDSTAFRGGEPDSRAARATGSVIQAGDRVVTIGLGSLDGLAKGSEVELVRDGQAIGKLTLTTIFRDHARGLASPGTSVHVSDEVRIPPKMVLRAALDRIDALIARGDFEAARRIAEQVPGESADPVSMSPADWNNLGAIAELHGARVNARMFYERALRENPPPPARQSIKTNLARLKAAK
jgi:hypothetical protein